MSSSTENLKIAPNQLIEIKQMEFIKKPLQKEKIESFLIKIAA